MDLANKLIELRILLTNCCDGFSQSGNKDSILSTRLRVLYMLEAKDCSPNELIEMLCIAKSNLANILKKMIEEGVVDSYKLERNTRNIFYSITEAGLRELKSYKQKLMLNMENKFSIEKDELSNNLQLIINILKGTKK